MSSGSSFVRHIICRGFYQTALLTKQRHSYPTPACPYLHPCRPADKPLPCILDGTRSSAVERGYWEDRFLQPFCPSRRKRQRRPPIIHRGYYARTKAVYILVKQFIAKVGAGAQIVNLGAGNDTLYWRLKVRESKGIFVLSSLSLS